MTQLIAGGGGQLPPPILSLFRIFLSRLLKPVASTYGTGVLRQFGNLPADAFAVGRDLIRFDTPPEANPARQSKPKRETRPTADWPLGLQHSCPPGKNGYLRAKILRKADFSAVARGNKATPDLLPDLISDLESAMDKKKSLLYPAFYLLEGCRGIMPNRPNC